MRYFIDESSDRTDRTDRTGIDTEMDNVMFVPIDLDSDTEIDSDDSVQYIWSLFSSCFPMGMGCLPAGTAQEDLKEIAEVLIKSEPNYQEVREIRIQMDSHHIIQQIILNGNTHLFYNRRSLPELKSIIDTWFHENSTEFVAKSSLFEDLESYYAEVRQRFRRFNWYDNFSGGWIKFTKSEDGTMRPCGFRHSYTLETSETSEVSEE